MAEAVADTAVIWTPIRSVAGKRSPWVVALTLSLATFMFALDSSVVIVILNHVAGELGATYSQATWVMSSYMIAAALALPVAGWLSQVIGRKRFYMICVGLFLVGSLACGLAPSFGWLIAARIIQGLGGGGLQPAERSMLADTFPPSKLTQAFALYAVVALVGPALGPVVGGVVTDSASWRWIFLMNVPVGVLSLTLVWFLIHEPPAVREDRARMWRGGLKIDWLGFLLVVLGIGPLYYALDHGQTDGWFDNPMIATCLIVSAIALVAFIGQELRSPHPILEIRLFRYRNLATATGMDALINFAMFGTIQLMPQLLQQTQGYSAYEAGLTMGLGAIGMLLTMPLVATLSDRMDRRLMVGMGLVVAAASIWPLTQLGPSISFQHALWLRFAQCIGLPFLFIPTNAIAFVGLPSGKSAQGSSLMELSSGIAGSLAIALIQVVLYQRQQLHQARIVEGLNSFNHSYTAALARMTQLFVHLGHPPAMAGKLAQGTLFQGVMQQASMLGFIDVAWILVAILIVILPAVFLLKGGTSQDAHVEGQ